MVVDAGAAAAAATSLLHPPSLSSRCPTRTRRPSPQVHGHGHERRHARPSRRLVRYYQCTVTSSVIIYWLFVSLIPIYNKFFFQKSLFPYPIATAGIQLLAVSAILGSINVLQHYYYQYICNNNRRYSSDTTQRSFFIRRFVAAGDQNKNDDDDDATATSMSTTTYQQQRQQQQQKSWIFGPYLFWKLRWCCPIGILFGLKYGVTNLGLHLVPAPIHLLLQATDLVWTVLGAWLINGEKVNWIESICLMGCVGGSLCLGWQIMISDHQHQQQLHEQLHTGSTTSGGVEDTPTTPLFAICVNLTSPMLLGLCISTLRLACTELMRPNNRVGGTVSAIELTAIKLSMSSAVALLLAGFMERGGSSSSGGGSGDGGGGSVEPSWWTAFLDLPVSTKVGVLGGSILIAVFQANCTFLTYLTSAVTVGLVGQVKIIPQWIMATIFSVITTTTTNGGSSTTGPSSSSSKLLVLHPTALFGAFLICGSAAVFAYANYREVVNIAHLIVAGQNNTEKVAGDEDNENGYAYSDDDNNGGDDDNNNDDMDGGSSAFVALTNTLSRRRSSVLTTRSGGGSDAGAIMLSSHSLRISLTNNNNDNTTGDTKSIKPLLLVSDADFWGENLMRFDEFDSTTDDGEDEGPDQLQQQNTGVVNTGTTGDSGTFSSTEKTLLANQHDGHTTTSATNETGINTNPPNYNSVI